MSDLLFRSVLFVSTHGAARSPMAAGLVAAATKGSDVTVTAAGLSLQTIAPETVEVMRDLGGDVSGLKVQTLLDALLSRKYDVIIPLSEEAAATIGEREGQRIMPWLIPDPAADGSAGEAPLEAYRRAVDAIKLRVDTLFQGL